MIFLTRCLKWQCLRMLLSIRKTISVLDLKRIVIEKIITDYGIYLNTYVALSSGPHPASRHLLLFLYCQVMESVVGAGFNMLPNKLTNWPGKWPWGWLLRARGDRTWQSAVWTVEWRDFSPHREEHMLHRWWHPWSVSRRVFHGHRSHQNLGTVGVAQ